MKKRKREEEKEENETETVKRRCDGFVSVEAFEIFCQGTDLESCGNSSWEDLLEKHEDLSDCEPEPCAHVRVVPDVAGVPVAPSSVVTEWCEAFSCCPDWEDVVPQSFSFSEKRAHCCTSTQQEMRCEGSQGKAHPMTRRRMTPHTSAKFVRLLRRGARELRSRIPSGVPFWLKRLKSLSPVSFSVALAALTIFVFIVVLILSGGLRY